MKRLSAQLTRASIVTALFIIAGAANAQPERVQSADSIQVGTVNARSASVNLSAVGKEVSPGMFEVDPKSVRAKRLVLSGGGGQAVRSICIGKWKNGECKGILIEW